MCGICGKIALQGDFLSGGKESVVQMARSMSYRGPDEEGFYVSGPVAFGHKRLKIIDLSTGQQPLSNEDQTIWVVFNGEIYNFKELRQELISCGHEFRSSSDTEVIVHLYEEYGEQCVSKLAGMFSFAIWDGKARRLLLARDRVGIKPFYYAVKGDQLLFASEVKAILAEGTIQADIEPAALDRFLTYYYVPGEDTLFRGIHKLLPGHYMVVEKGKIAIREYWDLHFSEGDGRKSFRDYQEELGALLRDTVRSHMISDVPVGILLSGGVDSTAMLSFAAEQTSKQINTFTVGFNGEDFADERPYARLASEKYGSSHHEMTISASDFIEFLPKYVFHMEEPICEPPAIALYYVSRMAKGYVTVLLSGEGGDEVFAGYQNYRNLMWLEKLKYPLAKFAGPISHIMRTMGKQTGSSRLIRYAGCVPVSIDKYYYSRTSGPTEYFNRHKETFLADEFKRDLNSGNPLRPSQKLFDVVNDLGSLNKMLYVDTKTWLPDDLLLKADKMTMANSLELRVPLLDHRVLEFGASLPAKFKVNGVNTKHLLKKTLQERVPSEIIKRKKTGFPVPYSRWLKNECKEIVRSILLDSETLARGYFCRQAVEALIQENSVSGKYGKEIFSLMTLELWHRTFVKSEKPVLV